MATRARSIRDRVALLKFYGTGDEACELFQAGVRFLRQIHECPGTKVLQEALFRFLSGAAQLSKRDYVECGGGGSDSTDDVISGADCWF